MKYINASFSASNKISRTIFFAPSFEDYGQREAMESLKLAQENPNQPLGFKAAQEITNKLNGDDIINILKLTEKDYKVYYDRASDKQDPYTKLTMILKNLNYNSVFQKMRQSIGLKIENLNTEVVEQLEEDTFNKKNIDTSFINTTEEVSQFRGWNSGDKKEGRKTMKNNDDVYMIPGSDAIYKSPRYWRSFDPYGSGRR